MVHFIIVLYPIIVYPIVAVEAIMTVHGSRGRVGEEVSWTTLSLLSSATAPSS